MEEENVEQEILLEPEYAVISPVTSVNGKIGDVVLTTSDLENDSDYQTGTEVQTAIDTAIAGKQDTLTAGNGININAQNIISVDTTIVATQQNLANEVTNRENADNALQSQIDAISASSDVVDIVGTYAELQAYDTQHLKDNDIIKVLQDSTQNDATTYYRWSTTTQTFTLIGQEGPYYTKASADAQFVPQTRTVNGKALSSNITLNASDVSALSPSDVDTQLANSTNPVQNKVLYGLLGDMPADFFSGEASDTQTGTDITIGEAIGLTDLKIYGDTFQQTYSGKNLWSSAWEQGGIDGTTGENYSTNTEVRTVDYIAVEPNQHYAISRSIANGSVKVRCYDQNKQYLGTGSTYWTFISGDDGSASNPMRGSGTYCVIAPQTGVYYMRFTDTTNDTSTLYMMVEGDAAAPYEPYVGGQPSPSPDYPQEIQTVAGEQNVLVTGKNLLDISDGERTTNGVTFTRIDNTITCSGTLTAGSWLIMTEGNFTILDKPIPAGTYTLSISEPTTKNLEMTSRDSNGEAISLTSGSTTIRAGRTSTTFTTPVEIGRYRLVCPGLTVGESLDGIAYKNIQLEAGPASTTYEAYQSNDFPISLTGKNLFNKDAAPQGGYLATYSALSTGVRATAASAINYTYIRYVMNVGNYVGQTLTLSATASASASNLPAINMGTCDADGNNSVQKVIQTGTGELTVSYTIASGDQYIYFAFYANQVGTASVGDYADYADAQLELSATPTSYEPYFTPIELAKIGDYQDYIYKSGDDWYVHKEIRKRTLDGTETWTTGVVSGNRFFGLDTGDGVFNNTSGDIVFSDKFYNRFGSDNNSIMLSANSSTPGRILIFINGIATNVADWKTWLSNNNTLVYYPVTTPTDTKITDQTLIDGLNSALNMTCYDGGTNIVVTSTNLPGELELTSANKTLGGIIALLRG